MHTWCKSPIILVSDREFIEKRIEFIGEKKAIMFSMSVPEEVYPKNKDVIRCINFLNIQTVEDKDTHWLFTSFGQTDFKMPIPESFLNFTIPSKFTSWFEEFHKYLKKIK